MVVGFVFDRSQLTEAALPSASVVSPFSRSSRTGGPGLVPLLFESGRMGSMPKKIDPQLRARCVRLVREHLQEYPTLTAAVTAVARQAGVLRESVRRWLAQAEVDDGTRPGVGSEEPAKVKRGKAENRRLREDNEILRRASIFFGGGGSSTPETDDPCVHRRNVRRLRTGCGSRTSPTSALGRGGGGAFDNALMETINGLYKTLSASAPPSSAQGRDGPSLTLSSRQPAGSTGITTGASTAL